MNESVVIYTCILYSHLAFLHYRRNLKAEEKLMRKSLNEQLDYQTTVDTCTLKTKNKKQSMVIM